MARRTPTQDDTAAVSGPICGKVEDREDARHYVCIRNPGHLGACNPVPADREAIRKLAARANPDPGDTLVTGNPDVLPAASPPDGGQAADPAPPAVPEGLGSPSVSTSGTVPSPVPAGSGGGGSGRPLARRADDTEAAEEMVRAAMSVISQPAQADHAIRHSLELARVLKLAETAGSMFADLASGDLVSEADIRLVRDLAWRMAATRGVEP